MNNTLAIYIEQDYLIAGIEPLKGKFKLLTKRGIDKFPFYFFVDKINHKIDYSFEYKNDFEAGNQDMVGGFLNQIVDKTKTYKWYDYDNDLINLLLGIIDDVKNAYYYLISEIAGSDKVDENQPIPVNIAFSDNIKNESKVVLTQFINKHNFIIQKDKLSFAELLVNQFLVKNRIEPKQKKYAVLETLGDNLNMSVVTVYTGYDRERALFKSFEDFGVDPRVQVIAKKIVDDINRYEGLLSNGESIKKEYKRHFPLATKLIDRIESKKRPYINVDTTFLADVNRKLTTTLSVEEVEQLTSFHVRQFSRFFIDHFLAANNLSVESVDKILLIGNTLSNELVKSEFQRFGHNKCVFLGNDEISWILMSLLETEESSEIFVHEPKNLPKTYKEIPFITVNDLSVGQKVKLSNNNTDKSKGSLGKSTQEMEFIGSNKFKIIKSTRSLLPGDIAESHTPNWVPGIRIDLSIERKGKILGKFRTRQIEKIETITK